MLDQLVESKSNVKDGARRGKFLLSTFVIVCTIFLNGILWSLFAKDFGMGNEDLELSTLTAPVSIPDINPPKPEPVQKIEKQEQSQKTDIPTRQQNIARIDEQQSIPDKLSTVPNTQKARPIGNFKISSEDSGDAQNVSSGNDRVGRSNADISTKISNQIQVSDSEIEPPPVKKKSVTETLPKTPIRKTSGVVNGEAIYLPKPPYPPAAKAVHANGEVNVQVTINEKGDVISAKAISGHPLLKQVSETAARAAKFKPTLLSNQPVIVTGLIVYKFTE